MTKDPYQHLSLSERVVIVTGASSGIGRAGAKLLAARGAKVVVADVNEEGGKEVVDEIEKLGSQAFFCRADISKEADVENLIRSAVTRFGGLHGAFNNAGSHGCMLRIADMS